GLRPVGPEREHYHQVGHHVVDARRLCRGGDHQQLPDVPADHGAGVDGGVDVGEAGGDLVHGGRAGHGAGRLLPLQGQHPALLQAHPGRRRPAPRRALQPADRQLLPRRRRQRLRPGPGHRRRRVPGQRRPGRHHQPHRQGAQELHAAGAGARIHLRPRQGRPLHRLPHARPPTQDTSPHDVERDVHLLAAPGVQVPLLLRLLLLLLQRHHRALRQVRLRLRAQDLRPGRLEAAGGDGEARAHGGGGARAAPGQGGAAAAVHDAHVPRARALARQAQLQGVLARQDRHHQLQLPHELHAVDARRAAPQPRQHHRGLQLRLQARRLLWIH
ncbi:hypothetical protein ACJX0J_032535, partial [Zea mays]